MVMANHSLSPRGGKLIGSVVEMEKGKEVI